MAISTKLVIWNYVVVGLHVLASQSHQMRKLDGPLQWMPASHLLYYTFYKSPSIDDHIDCGQTPRRPQH